MYVILLYFNPVYDCVSRFKIFQFEELNRYKFTPKCLPRSTLIENNE